MTSRNRMDHEQFLAACNTEARARLQGRRIVEVRYLTDEECRELAWSFSAVALILDDGTSVYPARDAEGNDAGAIHGVSGDGRPFVLPELLSR